jgi:hypothetical protein
MLKTAMGFHGLIRATEDVDLLVRATEANIERLRRALRKAYADDPHIEEINPADLLGDNPAVRYYPPTGDLFFDVMTRLGEAAHVSACRETSANRSTEDVVFGGGDGMPSSASSPPNQAGKTPSIKRASEPHASASPAIPGFGDSPV